MDANKAYAVEKPIAIVENQDVLYYDRLNTVRATAWLLFSTVGGKGVQENTLPFQCIKS